MDSKRGAYMWTTYALYNSQRPKMSLKKVN